MKPKIKNKKGRDLARSKNKIALAQQKKIRQKITLLNQTFADGKISYLEYQSLLKQFKNLNRDYLAYIEQCEKKLVTKPVEKAQWHNLPLAAALVLVVGLIFFLPLILPNGGITGAVVKDGKYFGEKITDGQLELTFLTIEKTADKLILEFSHDSSQAQPIFITGQVDYTLSKNLSEPGELVRLEVNLVQDIVPKFQLQVGTLSEGFNVGLVDYEVYEFGKNIPLVETNGHYFLQDRADKTLDLQIEKDQNQILFKGLDVSLLKAQFGQIEDQKITTDVVMAEPVEIEEAVITLAKRGQVNYIFECPEIDLANFQCLSGWQKTSLPFVDNGETITFTVNHFSAYAGGQEKSLTKKPSEKFSVAAAILTTCGNISASGDYTLAGDVDYNGTCFNISASDVVLDCAGFMINYSKNTTGNGIVSALTKNVTIKNCNIKAGNASGQNQHGIRFTRVNASIIFNNTISTNGKSNDNYGLYLVSSLNVVVDSNNISTGSTGISGSNHGIYLITGSNYSILRFNTITARGRGIVMDTGCTRNNISFNNISTIGVFNGDLNLYGIYLLSSSSFNNIVSNIISTNGSRGNYGIYDSNNNVNNSFVSNKIFASGWNTGSPNYGINVQNSRFLRFENNTISTSGPHFQNYGIALSSNSHNNTFAYNNVSTSGNSSFGVVIASCSDNVFTGLLLSNPNQWILQSGASSATNFTDTTFLTGNGSVRFPGVLQMNGEWEVNKTRLNITYNNIYLNSTNLTFMNTSAEITLNGLTFTNPEPIVAFGDSASFSACSAPQCKEISYAGGTFVFNVSSFTTYSSQETNNYLLKSLTWSEGLVNVSNASMVVGDLNNDGLEDMILTGQENSSVYINNGTTLNLNISWGLLNASNYGSAGLADIDHDGDLDYLKFGESSPDAAFTNTGTALVKNNWLSGISDLDRASIGLGDLDNDGDYDLVISGYTSTGAQRYTKVYLFNGSAFAYSASWTAGLENVSDSNDGDRVVLADFDKDGDLDLMLFGKKASGEKIGYFYKNSGSNFSQDTNWGANLSEYSDAGIAVGDVDNDGDLDLAIFGKTYDKTSSCDMTDVCVVGVLICGQLIPGHCPTGELCLSDSDCFYCQSRGMPSNPPACPGGTNNECYFCNPTGPAPCTGDAQCWTETQKGFIYKNNGSALVESQSILSLFRGSAVFGDLDNNGYLDLFVTGENSSNKPQSAVYTNNAGTFTLDLTETNNITALYRGVSAVMADFNNDSKLDLAMAGQFYDTAGGVDRILSSVYINNNSINNTIPSAPNLFVTSYSGGKLIMNWDGASDTETGANGLYYNLRVGNLPGGTNDIRSGYYPRTSNPTAGYFGNIMNKNFINLSVTGTAFYWSVQTIDAGMRKSEWSAEQFYDATIACGNKNNNIAFSENFTTNNATPCFNITANNIVINCNNYYMISNGSNIAIYSNGKTGLQIKNCNFVNFTFADIVFDGVNNSLIDHVDVVINITNSDSDTINNSLVDALYVINSTNIWVANSTVANYTFNTVMNFTFESFTYGKIKFLQTLNSTSNNLSQQVQIGNNLVNVNTSAGFNTSAIISLYNIVHVLPKPFINTSSGYVICNESSEPSCYNLSYSNRIFTFNVSHFSDYISKEWAGLIYNSTWSANLPQIYDGTSILIDYNNDGRKDLHITGYDFNSLSYYNKFYINTGTTFALDGGMSAGLTGVHFSCTAMGDYDLDGDVDLIFGGWDGPLEGGGGTRYGEVWKNDGLVVSQDVTSSANLANVRFCSLALGDIDWDGDLDLAMQGESAAGIGTCQIYVNNGTHFEYNATWSSYCTGKYKGSIKLVDLNNDSRLDLLSLGKDTVGTPLFEVLINNGTSFERNSTWEQNLVGLTSATMNYADIDNDGRRDIIYNGETAAAVPYTYWFKNNGTTFNQVTNNNLKNLTEGAICLVDFNNDGWRDVYMSGNDRTNGIDGVYQTAVYLSSGNGTGLFRSHQYSVNLTPGAYSSCATSDFNNASEPDAVAFQIKMSQPSEVYEGVALIGNYDPAVVQNKNPPSFTKLPQASTTDNGATITLKVTTKGGDLDDGQPPDGPPGETFVNRLINDDTGEFLDTGLEVVESDGGQTYGNEMPLGSSKTYVVPNANYGIDTGAYAENHETAVWSTSLGQTEAWVEDVTLTPSSFGVTIAGDDCYLSSDGSQPGNDPTACTYVGNFSTINFTLTSLKPYNITFYYEKNITSEFSEGTLNNNWIGKVKNLTYIGNGTIRAAGWVNANYNTSTHQIMLVENTDDINKQHNYTIEIGEEFDALTPMGSYTNNLWFRVWV